MPTISRHEFSAVTYILRPIVDGKPSPVAPVRSGTRHRFTYRGAVVEIVRDVERDELFTALIEFSGQKGVALQRRLKREARKRGITAGELARQICFMVARDVLSAPVSA